VSLILRKIRKAKWYKHGNVPWLEEGELQADALVDLRTEDNSFSVYRVEWDGSSVERVAAAIMAAGDNLANFDYALVHSQVLDNLAITTKSSPGKTPDDLVNTWHLDLIHLTAQNIFDLAQVIFDNPDKRDRLQKSDIKKLIEGGISSGHINRQRIKPDLLKKLSL
jgi:hypothetical protein